MIEKREPIVAYVLNNEVNLDEYCYECTEYDFTGNYGNTRIVKEQYTSGIEKCKLCNDTRFVLTSVGEAIIQLVDRHVRGDNLC